MAKYQKYAEYKDSGVEWLGEIPNDWEMWKLSHAYTEIGSGTTPSTSNEENFEGNIPWVTTGELRENLILDTKKNVSQRTIQQFPTLKKYPIGSVAIAMYGATIGRLGIFGIEATTNQACCVMTTSKVLNNKYVFYWLQAFKNEIIQLSSGGGQPNINQEKVASLKISAPFFEDQINIANFLDHETAQIDTLIAKQEKLIELLKEKRQAVISHAVTKGLNPDVNMKDSGVEWLGQVPEHWDVIAISKVTQKITNGYVGPTRDILVEEGIPYVQATHIKKGKVNFDNAYFVREKWSNDHAKSILKKDDVLIVQTGAGTGDVGLVSESEEGFNCHALIILQPKKQQLSGSYLAYCLQSDYGYATLYSIRTGGMHPHLNCGEVQFVKISVPPLDEQVAISKFIEKNIQDFDQLIEKAKLAIQLMQERRTALISSAVTGKIDVRHHASHPSGNDKKQKEGI
ncbi:MULTISPECIES: restriction endonuclease subunit S [Acinetobacter]|uniref:restriction endonuclease subunit S n=1 Tax=Acinetobacter TaxID=469 RepID=UPI00158B0D72|nr:restriction endonuclease subunit S [Acinetobacter sp. FDAARGOS_724]QKW82267.1 restriction endonuclease subunit S [Acinetobacter sp. FDAARGOS_724]